MKSHTSHINSLKSRFFLQIPRYLCFSQLATGRTHLPPTLGQWPPPQCLHSPWQLCAWQKNGRKQGKNLRKTLENNGLSGRFIDLLCWICCNQRHQLGNLVSQRRKNQEQNKSKSNHFDPARVGSCDPNWPKKSGSWGCKASPTSFLGTLQTATNRKSHATKRIQVHVETLPSS